MQIAYDMCSFHISGIKEPVAQIVTTHLDLALVQVEELRKLELGPETSP